MDAVPRVSLQSVYNLAARIGAARRACSIWGDSARSPRTREARHPETRRADSTLSRHRRAPAASCDPTRRVPSLKSVDKRVKVTTQEIREREYVYVTGGAGMLFSRTMRTLSSFRTRRIRGATEKTERRSVCPVYFRICLHDRR